MFNSNESSSTRQRQRNPPSSTVPPEEITLTAPVQHSNIEYNSNLVNPAIAAASSTLTNASTSASIVTGVDHGLRPGSVINLTNSSDVVIGPMTQYQGAVTIYQYMDATVESKAIAGGGSGGRHPRNNSGSGNSNNNINQNQSNESSCIRNEYKKSCIIKNINTWILISILIAITIGIIFMIFFLLTYDLYQQQKIPTVDNSRIPAQHTNDILFENHYDDAAAAIPNLGNGHLVIDRKQWGSTATVAYNNNNNNINSNLTHPIPYVIITHIGVQSNPCDNVYNCSIKMRTIQDAAIAEKGLSDLPANFYVSNDGYVYVGRGWSITNAYFNYSLAICFMGDYTRHKPTEKQLDGVQHLLMYGMAQHYIDSDYKLIAHNQTSSTKSPGINVYNKIIKWPHWYSCGMDGNSLNKCEI